MEHNITAGEGGWGRHHLAPGVRSLETGREVTIHSHQNWIPVLNPRAESFTPGVLWDRLGNNVDKMRAQVAQNSGVLGTQNRLGNTGCQNHYSNLNPQAREFSPGIMWHEGKDEGKKKCKRNGGEGLIFRNDTGANKKNAGQNRISWECSTQVRKYGTNINQRLQHRVDVADVLPDASGDGLNPTWGYDSVNMCNSNHSVRLSGTMTLPEISDNDNVNDYFIGHMDMYSSKVVTLGRDKSVNYVTGCTTPSCLFVKSDVVSVGEEQGGDREQYGALNDGRDQQQRVVRRGTDVGRDVFNAGGQDGLAPRTQHSSGKFVSTKDYHSHTRTGFSGGELGVVHPIYDVGFSTCKDFTDNKRVCLQQQELHKHSGFSLQEQGRGYSQSIMANHELVNAVIPRCVYKPIGRGEISASCRNHIVDGGLGKVWLSHQT